MADNTKIEWTDATWNPVNGCSLASPGCTNCYAMKQAHRVPQRRGLTQHTSGGMVWTGEVRFDEAKLTQPLHWKRPRRIFVCAHGDLFHDAVPDEWIDRVFAVMALCPQHTFQVLTKRSARMRAYLSAVQNDPVRQTSIYAIGARMMPADDARRCEVPPRFPLPNVWLGVSVEDQRRADERIPDLLATPAAVRWLSCEPLLGPVDLRWVAEPDDEKDGVIDALLGCNWIERDNGEEFRPVRPNHQDRVMRRWVCSPEADILANRKLDWVVAGGESGPGARPMHPDWPRALRDQCAPAGVPFFFKQWGDWAQHPSGEPITIRQYNQQIAYIDVTTGQQKRNPTRFSDETMRRIGKRAAGRLLDGTEHNAMPKGAAQ